MRRQRALSQRQEQAKQRELEQESIASTQEAVSGRSAALELEQAKRAAQAQDEKQIIMEHR